MIKNILIGISQAVIWYFVGLKKGRDEKRELYRRMNAHRVECLNEQREYYESLLVHWKLTGNNSGDLEVGKEYLIMCGVGTHKRLAIAKWLKFHGEEAGWYFDNRAHSGWNYVKVSAVYAYAELPFQPSEWEVEL